MRDGGLLEKGTGSKPGELNPDEYASLRGASSSEPAAEGTKRTPEVWLCHHNVEDLVDPDADWDFVRDHLDGIKIYVGSLMGTRKHVRISDENLASLAGILEENDIQLAMECGGTLGHFRNTEPVGLRSANAEMRNIGRVVSAGGTMHYLDMDGPISRTLWSGRHRFDYKRRGYTGYDEIDKCVAELIVYMKQVNRQYPDLKFFTLTNFPNWGWKGGTSYHSRHENNQDWGDYYDVISTLLREAKEAGVANLGSPSREDASRVRSGYHDRPDESGHHEGEGYCGRQYIQTGSVTQAITHARAVLEAAGRAPTRSHA